LQNALETIADEVGAVAARNAYSPFVNQSSGIATAFFDDRGRLIAQTRGGEFHCSGVRVGLQELLKNIPASTMADGDSFILNDHFRGGIHPTDVMVLKPIFVDGALAFFHGALMIVSDLGGLTASGLPGTATECFHEGVMIPGLHLFRAGQRNDDVYRLIEANSRTPNRVIGDVNAMVAAGNVAGTRLRELAERYGLEVLKSLIDELIDYGERMARDAITSIPDGSYTGTYLVEDDGIVMDKSYWIRVRVDVNGADIRVDLTGTEPRSVLPGTGSTWTPTSTCCFGPLRLRSSTSAGSGQVCFVAWPTLVDCSVVTVTPLLRMLWEPAQSRQRLSNRPSQLPV
jgi:N-methylhydantoinase B